MMNTQDPNVRHVELYYSSTNTWKSVHPSEVKKGMYFRMFEPNGDVVLYKGKDIFLATKDSYIRDDGVWTTEFDTSSKPKQFIPFGKNIATFSVIVWNDSDKYSGVYKEEYVYKDAEDWYNQVLYDYDNVAIVETIKQFTVLKKKER